MPDIIPDDKWDAWLNTLVRMLDKYEKKLDVVTFLGQIKQKIDDCSRTYTAIWIIEMLFQSVTKLKSDVGDEFKRIERLESCKTGGVMVVRKGCSKGAQSAPNSHQPHHLHRGASQIILFLLVDIKVFILSQQIYYCKLLLVGSISRNE